MPVPTAEAVSPRRLIRDEVFDRLLNAIIDGSLTPGEQLYDTEIERWVGVSRTPVREALNQLGSMGLVEIMPQKKTRVTPIDPDHLRGLIATLGVLHTGAARDVTPFLNEEDLATLRATAGLTPILSSLSPTERDHAFTEGFTVVFLHRLDNATLGRLFKRYLPTVRRALAAATSTKPLEAAQLNIDTILTAAHDGDSDAVAQAVSNYWTNGIATITNEFVSHK